MPSNREIVTEAFTAWMNGTGYVAGIFADDMTLELRDGKVVDGTAFFDSIAFNELWETVPLAASRP